MDDLIKLDNVSKVYKSGTEELIALNNINLTIKKGESLAITGKSGSGKSTLLHILATLDRPTKGDVLILNEPVWKKKSRELNKLRNQIFGFVFQQFFLNSRDTCLENVILPLVIKGVGSKERNKKGLVMLDAVNLSNKVKQKASDLSGGQKQRLCIARALINNPQVILADEPTGNLDSENGQQVIDLLFKLQKENGITLVIVTHDDEIANLCERKITLKDGQIVERSKS